MSPAFVSDFEDLRQWLVFSHCVALLYWPHSFHQLIEVETKDRHHRHFQVQFHEWNFSIVKSLKHVPWGIIDSLAAFFQIMAWQSVIWTNASMFCWRIYASLGLTGLRISELPMWALCLQMISHLRFLINRTKPMSLSELSELAPGIFLKASLRERGLFTLRKLTYT